MDISKSLKCVKNITDYISTTHDLINKYSNSKIQFNMSTVLALKKIRSLEIEYFDKCDENGAAFKILELMLRLPPSKTWSLLGIELISLVQYWLDALRKHLIIHNHHWRNFLNPLLKFIQEIRLKDRSINNILVQETMECLLDLATDPHPDLVQRHRIIQCVNMCCADASREIRFALRNKFKNYFVKLSRLLASCGDVCTQYSILETLLRWLLPRQDPSLRREAAADWFPDGLYRKQCVEIFLERAWHNFFKDARDFVNAHNEGSDQITSIICKHFSIGSIVLVSEAEKKDIWLDLNAGSKCASLMLEPKLLETLGGSEASCTALVIGGGNVDNVQLYRSSSDVVIEMSVSDPKQMYPANETLAREVKIVVDGGNNLAKIDKALRTIYVDKYVTLIDLNPTTASDLEASSRNGEVVDGTSSSSAEPQRKRHSGFIVRSMVPVSWQSPSTASTSSLAMLREKLTAFSGFRFNKDPVSVCAAPQLSSVTELSEPENHSFNSTSSLKIRRFGVCRMRKDHPGNKCQSDGEVKKTKDNKKCISPIVEDQENSVSCLLIATIGSTSDSIINDTLERLPKDKEIHTDNIIDLLAQEALQAKGGTLNNKVESIDTNNKRNELNPSVGNKTLIEYNAITQASSKENKTKSTIISNTTTDESNTDVVEDTPSFVCVRKNYIKSNQVPFDEKVKAKNEIQIFDNQIVEEFFSQHLNENKNRELVISPSLARKINNTSSEESDDLDFLPEVVDTYFNINDIDIIECLNDIVDKVCKDFDKCTEYLNKESEICEQVNMDNIISNVEEEVCVSNTLNSANSLKVLRETRKSTKGIKLKYSSNKKQLSKTRANKKKAVSKIEPKRMSPIIERESTIEKDDNRDTSPVQVEQKSDVYDTPLLKRKRKLYSPKDDELAPENPSENSKTVCENLLLDFKTCDKTPKSAATYYKELENIRRNTTRKIRNKNVKTEALSSKSKKINDAFENLKTTIEGEKDIKLAERNSRNKDAVYNFTSDSEDEDFKKKSYLQKRKSSTTLESIETKKSSRRRQPNTRTNKRSKNVTTPKAKDKKIKKNRFCQTKPKKSQTGQIVEEKSDLIDERMRDPAPESLNISVTIENHKDKREELEPMLPTKPVMEIISDVETVNESIEAAPIQKKRPNRRNKKVNLSLKNKINRNKIEVLEMQSDRDKTESPLPGLVIEVMPPQKDPEDSITIAMLEGFKNISKDDRLQDLSGINTTQNLLSDIEPINYSLPYMNKNKQKTDQDQIEIVERPKRKCNKNVPKVKEQIVKAEHHQPQYRELRNKKIINISDNSGSLKTIITNGKSPITAHGDFEETPPDLRQLEQHILEPRELEVLDLNQSLKHYYKCLNKDMNESAKTDSSDWNNNLERNEKVTTKSKAKPIPSPSVSVSRLSQEDIKKWLPQSRNSVFDCNASSDSNISTHDGKSKTDNFTNPKIARKSPIVSEIRKSLISPVQLFDDFKPTKHSSSDEEDNSYIRKNTKKRKETSPKDTISSHSNRIAINTNSKIKNSSHSSKKSTSTKIDNPVIKTPVKRKISPDFDIQKRRKVENMETITESAPSVSSVYKWLNKNDPSSSKMIVSRDESSELSLKDNIENVLEKLDTTLLEIHHNTSKKFVSMFVGAQKRLGDMKEERRQLCKDAARSLLAEVVQLVDAKFTEIDRRSQEMDDEFMSSLKEQARSLLHEDCKQKRVMVTLLKEDVQAVLDNIASGKTKRV